MSNLNSKNNDWLLIVENVGQKLQVQNAAPGSTILEGVCAIFGQMNNNRRVYEKEEYLPHLTYLNEKISKRQLVGELDHPQNFEVSLKSASHIIEALNYDGGNKVNIRLRILENTPNGRIAKALLDGGVQLSVSSRAAGQVNESGKVHLQRIFTYDLVGEPGFTEAVLNSVKSGVNESFKHNFSMVTESYNSLKESSIINANHLVDISESLNFANNYKVYKINNLENGSGISFQEAIRTQKNNESMSNYVTQDQMNKYSEVLKSQFSGLKQELKKHKSILESANHSGSEAQLVGFVNYLAEQLEGVVNYADYLSSKLNESIRYTEHVAETTNNGIEYASYLGEKLNQSVNYQEYIAEKLNQNINYSEYLKENLNGSIKTLNNSIKYQNYLAEELDKGLQYTEYVAEGANRGLEFSEYLAENINANRDYAQYIAEKLEQNIGYSEYIAESLNGGTVVGGRNVLGGISGLNESTSIDNLISKVDAVITEVSSSSAKAVLEGKYPFLKVMSEKNKKSFHGLDTQSKQAIVEALNGSLWFTENDVVGIMEAVLNHKNANVPNYIRFMPVEYKTLWSQMNESEQNRIHAKAQLFTVNTPYQAKAFWDEMDLRGVQYRIEENKQQNRMQQLNESQSTEGMMPVNQVVEMQRGYSQNYLQNLQRAADFRK